jgi:hypothetical protein
MSVQVTGYYTNLNMDEDLLDRYFAGTCTPEEKARVELWLRKPVADEKRLLSESWRNVSFYIRQGLVRSFNPWSTYLAAACMVLVTLGGIGWKIVTQDYVVRNVSQHYEAFDANGLQLNLPPQAAARVVPGVVSNSADLVFCGNVRIHNTSKEDIDMRLNLSCVNDSHQSKSILLKARKDTRYVAFQYHFKSDELVVVEEDRIFDLPLPLQQKALEVLEI